MALVQVKEEALHERAQEMRDKPTPAELIALVKIREKYEYEHQFVFGFYILDFVIPSKLLIVELDGPIHNWRQEYDERRDTYCKRRKMNVLRVPNGKAHLILDEIEKWPDVEEWEKRWKTILRFTEQRKTRRRADNELTDEQRAQKLIDRRNNRKPRKPKRGNRLSIEEHNAAIMAKIEKLKMQLKAVV